MDSGIVKSRMLANTQVITGQNLIGQIVDYLGHKFADGAICLIYDRNVTKYAEQIIDELKKSGYRVFVQAVSSARHKCVQQGLNVPEYVRYIFAVGAGTVAESAKQLAKEFDIEWSLFLTAPSTDTILRGKSPISVFIDENVMINCPFECKAAGYGILFSQPLRVFETFFAKKVLAEDSLDLIAMPQSNIGVGELAYALLQLSDCEALDSAQIMAEILYKNAVKNGKRPRLIGEYKFLASACIAAYYSAYLGAPSIDAMPPSCRNVAADALDNLGYCANRSKRIDFFDANSYFRISYILGEYRMDLLEKLSSLDFHKSQRFWRRLYPDAGYWLKGEITCKDLSECLVLAGHESQNLLGYIYASGVMEKLAQNNKQ